MENLNKRYIIEENLKCKQSCLYFIKNYCYIEHPIKGRIKFDQIWDYQETAVQDFIDNRFVIVLKSRQTGFSTIVAAYCAWLMEFFPNKNILIMATKGDTAQNIITKVDVIIKNMPKWLQSKLVTDNTFSKKLKNGSYIKAISTSDDAGRSHSLSLLILDEAAFIKGMDDLWPGIYNTLSTGGDCIAISTPNGIGNWYHNTWLGSLQGKNEFKRIEVPWWLHPERDETWKEEQIKNDPKFAQEHELEFLTSGKSFISLKFLKEKYEPMLREPLRKEFDDNLFIWEDPDPNYSYIIPVDTATGDASDFSALEVIKIPILVGEKIKIVASYQGKIAPEQIGRLAFDLGIKYNNATVIPENTGIGFATVRELINLGYTEIFSMNDASLDEDFTKLTEEQNKIYTAKFGFSNNSRSRPIIMNRTFYNFMHENLEFYDKRIYDEFGTFAFVNKKPQALSGYNDDMVICTAIGLWALEYIMNVYQSEMDYIDVLKNQYTTVNNYPKNASVSPYEQQRNYEDFFEDPASYQWLFTTG